MKLTVCSLFVLLSGSVRLSFAATPVLVPDSPVPSARNPTISLFVDTSEVSRKLIHSRLAIPVVPGPLTLVYPKWIPGEHGPTGPIDNLAGLMFTAGGRTLSWRRDLRDTYAFHLTIPPHVRTLDVSFDFLLSGDTSGFSSSGLTTPNLVNVNWNQLLLYPRGRTADYINVAASLELPRGWKYGTALPVQKTAAETISFETVPLVTLIDSPVLAGVYYQNVMLTAPGAEPSHEIDMVGDSPAALVMPDATVQAYKNLVAESGALFGARHYRDYHFLYTLSNHVASFGLEHHESSDDRDAERTLIDPERRLLSADLLPHEFVHSWNGKYRRPYDLYTPDYQKPIQDDLLWVYEGLTQYYGKVLTARSGLWTRQDFQDGLATLAARMDLQRGRTWRPLQDTADDAQNAYNSPESWAAYRRGTDFYDEGVLIWLEADTIIRQQTGGKKSLDDFCRRFYGGQSGLPQVKTYTFGDVVLALNAVAPYDWTDFFNERLTRIGAGAPQGGIANSGWKLVYSDTPSGYSKALESVDKAKLFRFSLGLAINENGEVQDVIPGMPASRAGMAPGFKLVAVNGHTYSDDRLQAAIKTAEHAPGPFEIIARNGEFFQTYDMDYHAGLQYPHLERVATQPDLLSQIIAPRRLVPIVSTPGGTR